MYIVVSVAVKEKKKTQFKIDLKKTVKWVLVQLVQGCGHNGDLVNA